MSKGNTLCWTDIPVTNLDRAIQFYSAVLRQPVTRKSGPGFTFGLLPHPDANVSGCLCETEENRPSKDGPLVYLSVEGRLDHVIQAARKSGGRFVKDKYPIGAHGFRAVVRDSEGNRIAFHSHAP